MFRWATSDRFLRDNTGDIPWNDIGRQIYYFGFNGLRSPKDYRPVRSKKDIEDFAFNAKRNLEPYGEVTSIGGDADWIFDNEIIGTRKIRNNITETIERCGEGSLKALLNSSVERKALAYRNAKKLEELGVQVRIRNRDEDVRAVVVNQRDKKGRNKYRSACVWRRFANDESYVRKEGLPQEKGDMYTTGWEMEWVDKEGKKNTAQIKMEVLSTLSDYSAQLLKDSVRTIDDIIIQEQMVKELEQLEKVYTQEGILENSEVLFA